MQPLGILPGEQNLRGRPGLHRQHRAHGNRIAQAAGAFHRGDAHALIALTAVDLRGFAGPVKQCLQNRPRRGQQTILARCGGKLGETRAKHESSVLIAQHEAVALQRDRQTVGGRSRQAGGRHQLSESRGTGFQRVQNLHGFVEYTDAGMDLSADGVLDGVRCHGAGHGAVVMHLVVGTLSFIGHTCGQWLRQRSHNEALCHLT